MAWERKVVALRMDPARLEILLAKVVEIIHQRASKVLSKGFGYSPDPIFLYFDTSKK